MTGKTIGAHAQTRASGTNKRGAHFEQTKPSRLRQTLCMAGAFALASSLFAPTAPAAQAADLEDIPILGEGTAMDAVLSEAGVSIAIEQPEEQPAAETSAVAVESQVATDAEPEPMPEPVQETVVDTGTVADDWDPVYDTGSEVVSYVDVAPVEQEWTDPYEGVEQPVAQEQVAETPVEAVALTAPVVTGWDAATTTLSGTAGANAIVRIMGPDQTVISEMRAGEDGVFSVKLPNGVDPATVSILAADDAGNVSEAIAGSTYAALFAQAQPTKTPDATQARVAEVDAQVGGAVESFVGDLEHSIQASGLYGEYEHVSNELPVAPYAMGAVAGILGSLAAVGAVFGARRLISRRNDLVGDDTSEAQRLSDEAAATAQGVTPLTVQGPEAGSMAEMGVPAFGEDLDEPVVSTGVPAPVALVEQLQDSDSQADEAAAPAGPIGRHAEGFVETPVASKSIDDMYAELLMGLGVPVEATEAGESDEPVVDAGDGARNDEASQDEDASVSVEMDEDESAPMVGSHFADDDSQVPEASHGLTHAEAEAEPLVDDETDADQGNLPEEMDVSDARPDTLVDEPELADQQADLPTSVFMPVATAGEDLADASGRNVSQDLDDGLDELERLALSFAGVQQEASQRPQTHTESQTHTELQTSEWMSLAPADADTPDPIDASPQAQAGESVTEEFLALLGSWGDIERDGGADGASATADTDVAQLPETDDPYSTAAFLRAIGVQVESGTTTSSTRDSSVFDATGRGVVDHVQVPGEPRLAQTYRVAPSTHVTSAASEPVVAPAPSVSSSFRSPEIDLSGLDAFDPFSVRGMGGTHADPLGTDDGWQARPLTAQVRESRTARGHRPQPAPSGAGRWNIPEVQPEPERPVRQPGMAAVRYGTQPSRAGYPTAATAAHGASAMQNRTTSPKMTRTGTAPGAPTVGVSTTASYTAPVIGPSMQMRILADRHHVPQPGPASRKMPAAASPATSVSRTETGQLLSLLEGRGRARALRMQTEGVPQIQRGVDLTRKRSCFVPEISEFDTTGSLAPVASVEPPAAEAVPRGAVVGMSGPSTEEFLAPVRGAHMERSTSTAMYEHLLAEIGVSFDDDEEQSGAIDLGSHGETRGDEPYLTSDYIGYLVQDEFEHRHDTASQRAFATGQMQVINGAGEGSRFSGDRGSQADDPYVPRHSMM